MKPQNLIHILMAIVCIGLLPKAQAVSPPPPGAYPNFTTAAGESALSSLTSGLGNTGVGWFALGFNTTTSFNTAVGGGALDLNTADSNTAVGAAALLLNTTGTLNTATGVDALVFNDTGSNNTANGAFALFNNIGDRQTAVGSGALENCIAPADFAGNTAIGTQALNSDTTGNFNTAIGDAAMKLNTTGAANTAIGLDALVFNDAGGGNTATGANALFNNTEGASNTATGASAVFSNTTGNLNTGVGLAADTNNVTGSSNTAIGANAFVNATAGDGNTALGASAGGNVTTANNVICIGSSVAGANVDNTCFIGNIRGVTTAIADAIPVGIDSAGQLGTVSSSARFKNEIKPMDKASEAILALKPVTFHYKNDKKNTPQFGLIAEEVAKVNQDLVVRDKNGEIYTVRYDAVNAMLLNEFLKEHRKVESLKNDFQATVAQQQKEIAALTATVKEQASQIQKVSAQLEATKPAPQVVKNP